jgi:hypothetical protein
MLLACCSDRPPWDEAVPGMLVIDRIERQLAGRPCIGALDGWERRYQYAVAPESVGPGSAGERANRDRINFTFVEAGRNGFRPRRIIQTIVAGDLDERPMRFVMGEYHVTSGLLFVHVCGQNAAPAPQSMLDSFNAARDAP